MKTVFTHASRLPPAATVLVESIARTIGDEEEEEALSESEVPLTYASPLDCASDLLW
jgi:hypothetical protein